MSESRIKRILESYPEPNNEDLNLFENLIDLPLEEVVENIPAAMDLLQVDTKSQQNNVAPSKQELTFAAQNPNYSSYATYLKMLTNVNQPGRQMIQETKDPKSTLERDPQLSKNQVLSVMPKQNKKPSRHEDNLKNLSDATLKQVREELEKQKSDPKFAFQPRKTLLYTAPRGAKRAAPGFFAQLTSRAGSGNPAPTDGNAVKKGRRL